jgi:hypothetical protein
MELNKFVNGENFKLLCDIVIDQNSINNRRAYKNNSLIFCKTDYVYVLFNEIKNDKNKYTLITHQSDYEINEEVFSRKPNCIKNWFAQNVNYNHPNLIPIPIGIENHHGPSKGKYIDSEVLLKYEIEEEYNKNNLLYSNFNQRNHPERPNWAEQIQSLGFKIENERKSFFNYVNDLKNSYFSASPRGNGIDCHRTWESLYYDCIPIVQKHFIYDSFDAPIIQIEKSSDLTHDLLNDLKLKYKNKTVHFDKKILTINYWHDKIKSKIT